jgi:hypothetical protein
MGMNGDAAPRGRYRGQRLLLDDIRRLDALENRVCARDRVEETLGADLTGRLLAALAPRRRRPVPAL